MGKVNGPCAFKASCLRFKAYKFKGYRYRVSGFRRNVQEFLGFLA